MTNITAFRNLEGNYQSSGPTIHHQLCLGESNNEHSTYDQFTLTYIFHEGPNSLLCRKTGTYTINEEKMKLTFHAKKRRFIDLENNTNKREISNSDIDENYDGVIEQSGIRIEYNREILLFEPVFRIYGNVFSSQ